MMEIRVNLSLEQCERVDFLVEHFGSENVDSLVNFLICKHYFLLAEREEKKKKENLIEKYRAKPLDSEVRHTL